MNPCAVGIARGKRNSVLAGFTLDGFPMRQFACNRCLLNA